MWSYAEEEEMAMKGKKYLIEERREYFELMEGIARAQKNKNKFNEGIRRNDNLIATYLDRITKKLLETRKEDEWMLND